SGGFNAVLMSYAADGTLMVTEYGSVALQKEHKRSLQGDLLGVYDIDRIGAKFTILTGADVQSRGYVAGGYAPLAQVQLPVNPWNPHAPLGPNLIDPEETALVTTGSVSSIYAQGQLKFLRDRVQFTTAVRRIWQDERTVSRATGVVTVNDKH